MRMKHHAPMKVNIIFSIAFATIILLTGCFRTADSGAVEQTELSTSATFQLRSIDDLYQFMTYDENRYPLVSAHRGGPSASYPENAIATFAFVAKSMPVIIECDVRLSKDSVLVLMHDQTLDRTTNGNGDVSNYTLQELKRLKLKDASGEITPYLIPTLEEALIWGRGKVIYTLDVKKEVPYSLVSQAIQKHNAQPFCIVITYNANQAAAVYRADPTLMISATVTNEEDFDRLTEKQIPDNLLVAFIGTKQANPKLISKLHSHGIKTILGTIGNLDKQAKSKGYQVYAEYIENGADIISTDRPLEAQKALNHYIRKRGLTSPYINN